LDAPCRGIGNHRKSVSIELRESGNHLFTCPTLREIDFPQVPMNACQQLFGAPIPGTLLND
jgi:hypothetical protein